MQLSAIDMNLLVALDALLAEGSVTRAAARVGLSPSAMSHALARLRKLLDDPILLRSSGGLSPTPRARTLQPELREALDRIRAALAASPAFDPASSNQTFSVSCQDVTQILLIPRLLRLFETLAPARASMSGRWPLAARCRTTSSRARTTSRSAVSRGSARDLHRSPVRGSGRVPRAQGPPANRQRAHA
jgi:DNA-binding transcriptional LysR family regulator